jgi:hypothetical protein
VELVERVLEVQDRQTLVLAAAAEDTTVATALEEMAVLEL